MRAPRKTGPRSLTQRDPMPRYGLTLDIFAALDQNDLAGVIPHLADDVHGSIRLPDGMVAEFRSRSEYVEKIGLVVSGMRAAGVTSRTKITNYDASDDPCTILASIDLMRLYVAGSLRVHLRGHATFVWSKGEEGHKISQWRITWEKDREQSGDWTREVNRE